MLSFHNDQKIKDFYLNRVKAHQLADEIVQGTYYKVDRKGKYKVCAVGCTIHGSDHSAYERELGIPRILARLEDGIFENLPNDRAKLWPEEFLSAINVGADLSEVWPKFAIWLMIDPDYGVMQYAKTQQKKDVIQQIADGYANYKSMTQDQWIVIRKSAAAYAYADAYAAAYAAAAAYADADDDAAAAADAAYAAAAYAAYADSAAAYAGADADAYARSKHRVAQADKLLELLKDAK